MDKKEQAHADSENKEPTEAEKVLGSMPEFKDKLDTWRPSEDADKNAGKIQDDFWASRVIDKIEELSDYDLVRLGDNLGQDIDVWGQGVFGREWGDLARRRLTKVKEEINRRGGDNRSELQEAKEIYQDTTDVQRAIYMTKRHLNDYFENTCKQRLEGGAGSTYDGIETTDEMKDALIAAHWKKAEHPDVMPGCQAYKTEDIKGGHLGLVSIAELPDDATIIASDPKGTGKVSMTVTGQKGPETKETWLIVGKEDDRDVVFTFHPGEPVRPSIIEVKDCPDGTKLTKEQAIALGFDLAKII